MRHWKTEIVIGNLEMLSGRGKKEYAKEAQAVAVSNEVRAASGVAAGDEVEVELELDTAPREVSVPAELAGQLEGNATAGRAFEALSYSKKRLIVDPVANARTAETRDRNIANALSSLRQGS